MVNTGLNRRFAYIDALRGVACIWVMIHHALQNFPVARGLLHLPLRTLVAIANYGWLGVSLFLVLSGFCLYFPLMRNSTARDARVDIAMFARRRARRILPPYYAALVLSILLIIAVNYHRGHAVLNGVNAIDILRHIFLIHNLWPESFASINSVLWSLALETQLYVTFPLLVYFIATRGFAAALIAVLTLSLLWQLVAYLDYGFSLHWTAQVAVGYHALPARVFEFLAGMVAAHFVTHPHLQQVRIAGAIIVLLLPPAVFYVGWISRFGPLLDQLWGVIFAAMMVAMSHVNNHKFEFPSLLGALNWVGGISFSIYLVHSPLFVLLSWRNPNYNDVAIIALAFAKVLIGIGLGYGFYWVFERPFIHAPTAKVASMERSAVEPVTTNQAGIRSANFD